MILNQRSAGVLLHITSLPGPHGIGDFGPDARRFVDWLAAAGQRLWQLLPTNPIGPCDSPYQSVSAFAGSPLMVAIEPLVELGWLATPVVPEGGFDAARVDYARVVPWRLAQLRAAWQGFAAHAASADRAAFGAWCAGQAAWLDDYVLFMAIEAAQSGAPWWRWPAALRGREPAALVDVRRSQADEIGFWQFVQWCFDTQAAALKRHANAHGVVLMGDVPIFVAHHSADCWARPDLYALDADFQPRVVAGVPPDAFAAAGQRWGNPLYRWDRMAADGYAWWTARVRRALAHVDLFRIDHFRGFAAYWEVPASCPTAIDGRWVPGPGRALFDALGAALGPLPIVAEDLGLITPDVVALREACGFPGMRILQFGFGGDASHFYLPHHHVPRSVAYTGTHDNDTMRGWWGHASEHERAHAAASLGCGADDVHSAAIRAICAAAANTVIFPLQDVLGLDGTHRMNLPGTTVGNWAWRFEWSMLGPEVAPRLAELARATGRSGGGLSNAAAPAPR